ncbi:hypothetical protein ACFWN1_24290 [Streptomyces sp. NPDC058459]|uniref:hypothetical protein n=1 Tax=Streptomyces sp. NPDC058459 TaxID=3346508 RepID=UPI00365E862F
MADALRRAADASRGITGEPHVAFLGEWTALAPLKAVGLFRGRHPECRSVVREARLSDSRASLLDGSVDVLTGEGRVPARHPLAGEESVSLKALADHPVVQYPAVTSAAFERDRTPDRTPRAARCRRARPEPRSPRC